MFTGDNRMKIPGALKLSIIFIAGVAALALGLRLPATAASRPLGVGAAFDGATVYAQKCVVCHGKDGRGTEAMRSKGQPDFTTADFQKSRTNAQIEDAIANGKGKLMVGYKGKISDDDIKALVLKVRSFGKK
jgi:cytochrome c6